MVKGLVWFVGALVVAAAGADLGSHRMLRHAGHEKNPTHLGHPVSLGSSTDDDASLDSDVSEAAEVAPFVFSVQEVPDDEEPTDDEPTDDEPTDDEPTDDEPADDEPTDDEPADDEPSDDEPWDEELTDEPCDDKPTDEPWDEEPTEPADDEPTDEPWDDDTTEAPIDAIMNTKHGHTSRKPVPEDSANTGTAEIPWWAMEAATVAPTTQQAIPQETTSAPVKAMNFQANSASTSDKTEDHTTPFIIGGGVAGCVCILAVTAYIRRRPKEPVDPLKSRMRSVYVIDAHTL
ncbi:hypothetical protein ACHHYP_09330 [Achlya hypogyna]|uniref:Secreted protein n=1 Tax=Achlya hypogyna TaxID=1202772 RepID=A0A1V9YNG2_ACHHY|nr:hypothetical protein ACHHYP_09330 [Achlya hypogyna]